MENLRKIKHTKYRKKNVQMKGRFQWNMEKSHNNFETVFAITSETVMICTGAGKTK